MFLVGTARSPYLVACPIRSVRVARPGAPSRPPTAGRGRPRPAAAGRALFSGRWGFAFCGRVRQRELLPWRQNPGLSSLVKPGAARVKPFLSAQPKTPGETAFAIRRRQGRFTDDGHIGQLKNSSVLKENYTTVDPKQFVFFKIETRACDVQSWEINIKDCKAETDTAVQSGGTHLKKEVRSPNSKPFGELFFKREHDAGHAAQSAGS